MTYLILPSINYPDLKITFNRSFTPSQAGKIVGYGWDLGSKTPEPERAAIVEAELELLCSRYRDGEGPLGELHDSYGLLNAIEGLTAAWAKALELWTDYDVSDDDEALIEDYRAQLRCYDRARDWVAHFPAQDFEDFGLMAAALLEVPPRDLDGTESDEFFHLNAVQCRALCRSAAQHIGMVASCGPLALQSGCREESLTEIVQCYPESEAA